MKRPSFPIVAVAVLFTSHVWGQSILFDFENAATHSPLPISLTIDGITAQLSGTGQGFSIQQANTMGFTPTGFSGNCLYPSSINASDLHVIFSQPLCQFSILYAPQELACDSSARVKVTAYMDSALVGTSTMVADPPGTWPSATLAINTTQGFNSVVVHYDAPPPTGGDWGPIFMADNMAVTPLPHPIITQVTRTSSGLVITGTSGLPDATYCLVSATSLDLPRSQWVPLCTNKFYPNGEFACTNQISADPGQQFLLLQVK